MAEPIRCCLAQMLFSILLGATVESGEGRTEFTLRGVLCDGRLWYQAYSQWLMTLSGCMMLTMNSLVHLTTPIWQLSASSFTAIIHCRRPYGLTRLVNGIFVTKTTRKPS